MTLLAHVISRKFEILLTRGVSPGDAYDTIVQEVCLDDPELVEDVEALLKAKLAQGEGATCP